MAESISPHGCSLQRSLWQTFLVSNPKPLSIVLMSSSNFCSLFMSWFLSHNEQGNSNSQGFLSSATNLARLRPLSPLSNSDPRSLMWSRTSYCSILKLNCETLRRTSRYELTLQESFARLSYLQIQTFLKLPTNQG